MRHVPPHCPTVISTVNTSLNKSLERPSESARAAIPNSSPAKPPRMRRSRKSRRLLMPTSASPSITARMPFALYASPRKSSSLCTCALGLRAGRFAGFSQEKIVELFPVFRIHVGKPYSVANLDVSRHDHAACAHLYIIDPEHDLQPGS